MLQLAQIAKVAIISTQAHVLLVHTCALHAQISTHVPNVKQTIKSLEGLAALKSWILVASNVVLIKTTASRVIAASS